MKVTKTEIVVKNIYTCEVCGKESEVDTEITSCEYYHREADLCAKKGHPLTYWFDNGDIIRSCKCFEKEDRYYMNGFSSRELAAMIEAVNRLET